MPGLAWESLLDWANYAKNSTTELKEEKCTLFSNFKPNAGGQAEFFRLLPLNKAENPAYRWTALSGGIGSGKTFCGAAWVCSRALLHPEARGLITANTYGQLTRSTITGLVEVCRAFNIPLEPYADSVEDTALAIVNRQRCYIGPQRTFVFVLSLGAFSGSTQAARGLQARWAWIDEAAFCNEQAFQTLDGRLGRGPGTMRGTGIITTSPNGFNWFYDRFGDPARDERRQNVFKLVTCPTRENAAYLGQEYIESLEANYTDELADQELEGLFVNTTTGRIFKYFSRPDHSLEGIDAEILAYDPYLDLHVCFDFNRSPACAVLCHIRGNEIHVFYEFYLKESDTFELAEAICRWIRDHRHTGEIYIYGDATGRIRTANSKLSNWAIVWQTLKDFRVRAHKRYADSNPPVISRINSVNCLFRQNRVFVHRHQCKELLKDFENLTWKGDEIDKSDPDRSHLADAFCYMAHWLFPYQQKAKIKIGQKPIVGLR